MFFAHHLRRGLLASAVTLSLSALIVAWPPPGKLSPENNVALIGHRKVGHGVDFYSMSKEIEMGRELAQEVLRNSKVITDPVINEYVNRVAQNLVRNSDAKFPFTVHVLQNDSINAFALPGGFFFINSGLILAMNREDELAAVMGHEMSHAICRHATRNASKADIFSVAGMLATMAAPGGYGGELATNEVANLILGAGMMHYSRGDEAEADWLGTQYIWKAGYDPEGMVQGFKRLEVLDKQKPGLMAKLYSDHPETESRIKRTQYEIDTILPPRPMYVVDTAEFHRIQARLRRLLAKPVEHGITIPPPPPPPQMATEAGQDQPPPLQP